MEYYYLLIALFTIGFSALCYFNFRWALFFIVVALPTYLIRFSLGPVPTTLLEVMLVVAILFWIFKYKGLRARGSSFLNGWRTPISLILIAATLGVLISPDLNAALGVWKAYYIEPIFFFLMVNHVLTKDGDNLRIINLLGLSVIVIAIFGLVQYFLGLGIPVPWDIEKRITSFYPFPNAVGLFVGPILVLAIAALAKSMKLKYVWPSIFWGVTSILGIVTIILSQTEAAWVAVATSLFILSLFYKKIRLATIPLAVICLVGILLVPVTRDFTTEKILLQDWSGQVRIGVWQETVELLKDNPVMGVGLSGFPIVLGPYHQIDYVEIFQYPHNIILNIWVELGILGLIAFIFLINQIISLLKRSFYDSHHRWLSLALGAVLLEMFIHGLVDVPYFKNDLALLTWIILSLLTLIVWQRTKRERIIIQETEIILYD